MNIPDSQFVFKKKSVGLSKGRGIFYGKTKGGLHMIYNELGKILGVGSHVAIAKHLAAQQDMDIEWTELAKSEQYAPQMFEHLLPKYRQLTQEIQKAQEDLNA